MASDVHSYWSDSTHIPAFRPLNRDLDVDVVIVGAGITGLTAAYLIKRAGRRVAVLERDLVGGVDTMRTTAHVTCVTDLDLAELDKNFGREFAIAARSAVGIHHPFVDLIERNAAENPDDGDVLVAILAHQDGHAEVTKERGGRHAGPPSLGKAVDC